MSRQVRLTEKDLTPAQRALLQAKGALPKTETFAQRTLRRAGFKLLEDALLDQIKQTGLPLPRREVLVVPDRQYRADFAWPDQMLAVEVQGGIWGQDTKSSHAHPKAIERDAEKHSLMAVAGWRLIVVTGKHIETGQAVAWIKQALS